MIKYFHKLTEAEFDELLGKKMTWGDCAELYPQPTWCAYPDAVCGYMGCWSLMLFHIKNKRDCYGCECFCPKTVSDYIGKFFRYSVPEFRRCIIGADGELNKFGVIASAKIALSGFRHGVSG